MFQSALDKAKAGGYVMFEITPGFTLWDYGKLYAEANNLEDAFIS